MKILFFLTSGMEKPGPSWHLMNALLQDTLNAGIQVHAIQRHYLDYEGDPFPKEILNNPNFSFSLVNVKSVIDRRAFVKRYLEGIKYSFQTSKAYRENNDYDLVFVQSAATSLFYLIEARHFAKKRPIIYNSQDMFPGSAVANGSMPKKWMQKIFYALQKIAYKKADIITAISEDMKIKLLEQGVSESKIDVIVNWYDDSAVYEIPWEQNRFVKQESLNKNKFYVQYAGTMGTNFNPDIILSVANLLKDYDNIEFQMIGRGVRKSKFEADVKSMNLNNIVFYPLQPQDMVSDVYSACSICLIPLKRGVIGNSVPSKAGLLMACGRVIVNSVDINSDYAQMFERESIGFSVDVDDSQLLAEKIVYLMENPTLMQEYSKNAKEYGLKEYSRKANTIKYIALFNAVANGER